MTLQFPNHSRSYDRTRQAVRFWGYDTSIEYSFFVTVDALARVEPHLRREEEGFRGAFAAHRDLICQPAAVVHSQGRRGRCELVGTDFRWVSVRDPAAATERAYPPSEPATAGAWLRDRSAAADR